MSDLQLIVLAIVLAALLCHAMYLHIVVQRCLQEHRKELGILYVAIVTQGRCDLRIAESEWHHLSDHPSEIGFDRPARHPEYFPKAKA